MAGNDSYVKLLLHCDGADASTTFTDASPSARGNATVGGNAQVDTAQSVFGGAAAIFDGSGDYLTYASHADWDLGGVASGDFTIDFRVRWNGTPGDSSLVSAGDLAGNGWNLYYRTSPNIRLYNSGGDSSLSWAPSGNTWYHVAVVRSSATITCYIDGTSIGTFTDKDMNNDSQPLYIGNDPSGFYALNGWIDELRISKGIARWTANFTPPSEAYSDDGQPYRKRTGGVPFMALNRNVW